MPSENATIHIATLHDLFPVELLDHQFQRLARAYGRIEMKVPPGIYLARCEVGGPAVERLIKVAASDSVVVKFADKDFDLMPSAAPVPGSVSRHEFYSDAPSLLAMKQPPHASFGSGARLVLFATQLDFAAKPDFDRGAPPVQWRGVKLLNDKGRVLISLQGDEIRDDADRQAGRAGFCADLAPGGYFIDWPSIESDDEHSALQPLWLSEGWTTFLFAGALGASPTPRRDTVSIHMARLGVGPPPYDEEVARVNGAAELALASLRTGRRQLGDEQLRMLLHAKFENPMLGLLGTHMLLQRSTPDLNLFSQVCVNLRHLLGVHPDLAALEVLARRRYDLRQSRNLATEFDFPPMLRDDLLALDRAQWGATSPIRLTAAARLARLRLLAEGPWTVFWHKVPATAPEAVRFRTAEITLQEWDADFLGTPRSLSGVVGGTIGAVDLPADGESSGEVSPFVAAQAEAEAAARKELLDYLGRLRKRTDSSVLRLVSPEYLDWSGLAPEDARAVIPQIAEMKPEFRPPERGGTAAR